MFHTARRIFLNRAAGEPTMEDLLPFSDPGYIASPYAHWRRLRDEAPVYWSEGHRFWAITRYDDVLSILRDPGRFSSRGGPMGRGEEVGLPRQPLIQDDPPHHDRLRRILSKAFTPRITAEREGRIRQLAKRLMDEVRKRVAAGEAIDLVAGFTSPFPVGVIAEILGIPPELHDRLRLWNAASSVTGAVELRDAHAPSVMREMYETLADLVEKRRGVPGSDLISALIDASELDESPLRPEELVGLCQLLWTAGNETTTNLLSNAALVLAARPDLLALVRDEPARIPSMVEELLRLESPVNCLARRANEDVERCGQTIHKDDVLMIFFAAANRDPRHFERADEFDPDRRPNDHVGFSHGIHFCLGSHLARLEARLGLELLGELLPDVKVRPELGARIPVGILRGWLRLPLEPRAGSR
jgi:cytochrome P450